MKKQCYGSVPFNYPHSFSHCLRRNGKITELDYAALFNELATTFEGYRDRMGDCEVNHITINLYLVIAGGRRGFLLDTYAEPFQGVAQDILSLVQSIAQKYELTMAGDISNGYFIAKEPIDSSRLSDELYTSYLLDFGCLDPNFNDLSQSRIAYHFFAEQNDMSYFIMTYVCTPSYQGLEEENRMKITQQIAESLDKTGINWNLQVNLEELAPWKRKRKKCIIQRAQPYRDFLPQSCLCRPGFQLYTRY